MPPRVWEIPQGLTVLPDGSWRVGDLQVIHPPSLRYLKSHLVFEEDGAFVTDGAHRMPIVIGGPAFEALRLVIDDHAGVARVVLDDGSEEPVAEGSIGMNQKSGRFECVVRGGRALALLSRGAHQTLMDRVEDAGGGFGLRVGDRVLAIRT